MPDQNADEIEELRDKVDRLENKVERVNGKNQLELKAYDISVKAQSEEASLCELARVCSSEMDELTKRALVGEYQEIEQEEMFSVIFGGD